MTAIDAIAYCFDCGWESSAINAHGNAARHSYAHGHFVTVSVQYAYGAKKKETEEE